MSTSILFADDSPAVRRAIRSVLTSELGSSIVCIEAGDGEEALSKAIAAQPDIVVLDIAMPGLNGLETARYIKQHCPKSAVLAISSYDLEAVIPRLTYGISGFVRKDAMGSDLLPAIQALLQGKTYFTYQLAADSRVRTTSARLT
ncbi:MAG: response regulator [Candidatus Acidiferrales bacterium]